MGVLLPQVENAQNLNPHFSFNTRVNAGANSEHTLQVTANGEIKDVAICGRGRKCNKGSVDYFTLDIERFGFSTSCVRKEDIEVLKLKEGGDDGWLVLSIFVFIDTCETHELASSDATFNKWVDADSDPERVLVDLTLVL